jgi:hypothetical protein
MTAYRQQALACAAAMVAAPARPRDLKPHVPDAPKILLQNVYGWFKRVERGVYALTDEGHAALQRWPVDVTFSSRELSMAAVHDAATVHRRSQDPDRL